METPILTKKQQKKSLSARKSKKETIKHVVAKSQAGYWPILSQDHCEILNNVLEPALPKIRGEKVSIPYKELELVPREDRKKFRENYNQERISEEDKQRSKEMVFGVNGVSKLLENQEAAAVLIAHDAQPRLLVQHIIDEAILYNVPVLVVINLRATLKRKCGISGVTVAFRKSSEVFKGAADTILGLSMSYSIPETHINFNRRLESSKAKASVPPEQADDESVKIEPPLPEPPCLHLKKPAARTRAFVPDGSKGTPAPPPIGMQVDSSGFLALGQAMPAPKIDASQGQARGVKRGISYNSLVVKRLKGDKNRTKRKMENAEKAGKSKVKN